jgi:hypothetical protein
MYAMPITIIAVILGLLGMKKVPGKGMATAGLVCGIIGTLVAGWWIYAYMHVKNGVDQVSKDFDAEMKKQAKEAEEAAKKAGQPDMPKADDKADDKAAPAPAAAPAAGDKPATP